ncbi:class I SAM-dependent methyltransferase [Kitasatospora paranensis]|uniref:Class I SAM-dependent methyltransferase n=1 Tax=Kitasatospora paranensis TaxID=258053 RepID=A0ABW2G1G2_9ACTN
MTTDQQTDVTAEEFWDTRYGSGDRIWSGDPNAVLVREVSGLATGHALDLGCGEGADAVWLAGRGWQVTAVDVSRIALARGAEQAESAGVADRIDWQQHDLAVSFPDGVFDLVSAHFLHSEVALPRDEILRSAAAAVAPGGVLLVVGHASHGGHRPGVHLDLPTPDEVLAGLRLPPGAWEVLRSEEHERTTTGPDGLPVTRTDNTLKLRRTAGRPGTEDRPAQP